MTVAASAHAEQRRVEELTDQLARRGCGEASVALVLGSGLGQVARRLTRGVTIPFAELDAMPESRVPGHAGVFVLGDLGQTRVLIQQGRVHLYEGWHPFVVTRSIRAFARLGIGDLVLTNAAGGLHADWPPGSLMMIHDQLNLQARAPLSREEAAVGCPYDAGWISAFEDAARRLEVRLEGGVYAGLMGPSYETPAEIRMLARLGADAVGMSTVAEAGVAAALGCRVAAVSCITNHAAGIQSTPLNHEEVVACGQRAADILAELLILALRTRLASA